MLLAERQEVIKMEKMMSANDMFGAMMSKGYDIFDMFCFGGTRSIFEVENLRDKVVYLDGHSNIILTDAKLVPQMGCVSRKWDKRLIIDKIEAAGLDKDPSLINEKTLKDIFEVNHPGRLYIREDQDGHLEAMAGFELEA